MSDVDRQMRLPAPVMAAIHEHFGRLPRAPMPVSVRLQVRLLRQNLSPAVVSDEDLIRAVERCAVEHGFSVQFDGHLGDDPVIAA